jgi:exopolysaccharide biosynthesis polyprenyl glycosylphosphotransferase
MSVFEGFVTNVQARRAIRTNEWRILVASLIATDAIVIGVSFVLAYFFRFNSGLDIFDKGLIKPDFYSVVVAGLIPAYLLIYHLYGLYQPVNLLGGTTEYSRLFNAVTTGILLVFTLNFIVPEFVVARAWLLFAWSALVVGGITTRFFIRRAVYAQRRAGKFVDRTVIVGANPEGMAVAEQLIQARTSGARIVGFIDDYLSPGTEPIPGVPVLGNSKSFNALVEMQDIDLVVIANSAISRERLLAIYSSLDTLPNIEVRLASGLFELLTTGIRVREEGFVPMVVLNKTRITGVHYWVKRAMDILVSLTALTLGMPIFIALYLMVKHDSPGPVIYRRRVVGQGRTEFDAFKFRTMYIDGDRRLSPEERQELESYGKLKDDPRVTKIGAILRKYSLDELPQLFNVLVGEMSLIGPRMITRKELEKFGKWQHNLSTVKPGLTGLWQVSGRSDLSYEDRVRLDMYYIRNHSIWFDLQILFRTIPVLLFGRGAY